METVIEQIKSLPKRKPVSWGKKCHASDLVLVHIQTKRVYGKKIPTYALRTPRGRKQATRWCMTQVPWVFTKEALQSAGIKKRC